MKKLFIMLLGILLISTALAITQNVTVTVTGEPSIILGAEPDGDDEIDDDGLVFASLDSNFGVHCKIKWEDVWEDIEASQTQDNYTFYDDGTYEIKYRCYDSLENYLTGVDTITLFRVPPEIYIHSPEDGSLYEEEEILINISTSRTTKEIRYSDNGRPFRLLCKNCSNVTILNDFGDGHHSFVVKITDLFNRNFFEEIEFDVDSAPPRIKSISPKNGEYTNGTFTVNYDEAWVSRAILFWKYAYETDYHNVTKFDCPSGMDKTCQITKEFEGVEGIEVDFYFEIHNAQGHDRSGVNRVTIDTIIPVMEVFLPVAGPLDKKQVYFNITINEIVDLEYKDLLSPSGKWKSLCKNCEEYGNSKKKYKTFNNGPYNLLIRAKDNAENQDTEMVEIFVDSKAPQILGFTPEDGEIIPRSLFEIEYTEEEFVERIELYWKIVGNESYNNKTLNDCPTGRRQTCSTKLNLTEYNNQSIEFFFKISDIASSTASEIATVEIDNDLPQVAINSPIANKNYGDTKILLDIEIDEMVETLEYKNMKDKNPRFRRLCHNCDSYNRIKSFEEGDNELVIMATDYVGNTKQTTIEFYIDSKKPRISRTTPRRNEVTNGSFFEVKYTEDNLESIKLFVNPTKTLENCSSGRNQFCSTSMDLSEFDGTYIEYYFEISDSVSTVQSKAARVFADTTSPNLTIYSPTDGYYGRRVPFNITVSEEVEIEYYDELAANPKWKRLCSSCEEYGFTRKKNRSFSEGVHNLLIRAIDEAGNSDVKEVSFEVL